MIECICCGIYCHLFGVTWQIVSIDRWKWSFHAPIAFSKFLNSSNDNEEILRALRWQPKTCFGYRWTISPPLFWIGEKAFAPMKMQQCFDEKETQPMLIMTFLSNMRRLRFPHWLERELWFCCCLPGCSQASKKVCVCSFCSHLDMSRMSVGIFSCWNETTTCLRLNGFAV